MAEQRIGPPRQRGALFELTRVRVMLFLREPEVMFWVFVFPVIMAVVLAFAFKDRGVTPSKIGVIEDAAAATGIAENEALEVRTFDDQAAALHALARGKVDVVYTPGGTPEITFDANREEAVLARLRLLNALRPSGESVPSEQAVTAVGSRYIDFLLPGLIGMNIMGTSLWGIGFFLVEQRQKKLLRRMLVTPMPRWAYLGSFITSRLVFLSIEVIFLTAFGAWALDVPFVGSILGYALLCVVSAMSFAGLGLLIASRARRLEGVSNLMNVVMMPMWLCSGVFFSYERFPEAFHPVCRAMPLTAVNDAVRGLMLDGAGPGEFLPELGVLLAWGVGSYFLALRWFRWE